MARASGGSWLISMLAHMAGRTVSAAGLICALLLVHALVLGVLGANAAPALETRAPGDVPVASDVRLAGDETKTRLIVDLDRKIEVRAFALANPYRVIIDMPQVTFGFPDKTGDKGRGLIKAFRYGLVMQGGSRIVIDLVKPARIERAQVLDAANTQPARLVLDLAATDRDTFMRTMALNNRPTDRPRLRDPEPEAKVADTRPLIVLDPGHGGPDHGTRLAPTESPEKTIVLEFCQMLKERLEKTGKYRVAMTRTEDAFVALAERVSFARERKAALFISVHADALERGDGDAQGATIYTLSETASDAAAASLAEVENRADVIAGLDIAPEATDVADILIDLAKRETKTFSLQFARTLVGELKNATRLHKEPMRSASFVVLKAPDIPSVLVELGYVTNKQDLKSMTSDSWRGKVADAVTQAVSNFFNVRTTVGATRPAARK
jgi:N-acetylmuramoyl-L-alanine amidase